MTDYSKMTDDELNEAIFKAKGWIKLPPPASPNWQRPTANGVEHWWFKNILDYTHDWRLAGELLEEMKHNEVSLEYFLTPVEKWECQVALRGTLVEAYFADTPQRAICEAWLACKADE